MKLFSLLVLLLSSYQTDACSCYGLQDFDLIHLDSYKYIFEVKVESTFGSKESEAKNELDSLRIQIAELSNSYKVQLIEQFKGNVRLKNSIMSFPSVSSCSWRPQVGETYIFYANSFSNIGMCDRKTLKSHSKERHEIEKQHLRELKRKPNNVVLLNGDKKVLTGQYKDGERYGRWIAYNLDSINSIKYEISYKDGKLQSFKEGASFKENYEDGRLISWHYDSILNKESKD